MKPEDRYNSLVNQYRSNPKNIAVCKALYNEYTKRGMSKNAKEMAQWIKTLKPSKLIKPDFKISNVYTKPKSPSYILKDNPVFMWCLWLSIIYLILAILYLPFVLLAFILFIGMLPSIIAFERHIQPKYGCLILNIATFWTFVGWVACLIWACSCAANGDKKL